MGANHATEIIDERVHLLIRRRPRLDPFRAAIKCTFSFGASPDDIGLGDVTAQTP